MSLSPATFCAVLDTLVPPRPDVLPGAGSLGVGDYVEERLGGLEALVAGGLDALDARAGDGGFAAVAEADRPAMLAEVAAEHPGFVESLVFHTYAAYYQHPRVNAALGLGARPPYPEGYPLEAGDLDLLGPVRERGACYREA